MATHATPSTLWCSSVNLQQIFSCQISPPLNQTRRRNGVTMRGAGLQVKNKRCQCLLFLDFLWDRWGDLDLERDFLVDFLGVLERDRLDRFGVRGEDGDLVGLKGHYTFRVPKNSSSFKILPYQYDLNYVFTCTLKRKVYLFPSSIFLIGISRCCFNIST